MKKLYWRLIPFFSFLVLTMLFWRGLALDPHHLPSVKIGHPVPSFQLETLDGKPFTEKTLQGQVSLLNVWASWCMSCADEQVVLMQLASRGIPIYGLNYKDKPNDAIEWLSEWGNPYRLIGQDQFGQVAIDMGVYGAPETFLIDAQGIIQYRHVGALTLPVWEKEFMPRMKQIALEMHQ